MKAAPAGRSPRHLGRGRSRRGEKQSGRDPDARAGVQDAEQERGRRRRAEQVPDALCLTAAGTSAARSGSAQALPISLIPPQSA